MRSIRARYLSEGAFRNVYDLLDDETGESTGRVLKVDNRQTYGRYRTYHAWDLGGCDSEVQTWEAVQRRCPELLPWFATIHAHGPAWLIQERCSLGAVYSPTYREPLQALKAAGIRLSDVSGHNLGRRISDEHPVILDFACVLIEGGARA